MSSLNKRIKETFDLASLRAEAAKILTAEEWKKLQEIQERFNAIRRFTERAYYLERRDRFVQVRKRLIDEAAKKGRAFKPRWSAKDRFDKNAINQQAHAVVRDRHEKDLASIKADETAEIRQLVERSKHRRELREKPRRDFNDSADRRSGKDRRVRKR